MKRPTPPPDFAGPSPEALSALLAHTPYRVVGFLGAGGMGAVWAIEHQFLRKRFALKVLHPHMASYADRMRVEAETMGRLDHPNMVEVVDFWVANDGRPCIIMELLNGQTLWEELATRTRLPVNEAIGITSQILSVLAAAHALGVVHRDLKPENIFLHEAPGYDRVTKVLDFGIARVLPNAPALAPTPVDLRTITGTLPGSPRFMSPEAYTGAKLDARADLYSLGLVLYVMLAGKGPFDTNHGPAEPPSKYATGGVPAELDAVVLRAIQEHPDDRYQSAADFLAALRPWLHASAAKPSGMRQK